MLQVVPRDQHPISRHNFSANALHVLYRLRDAGYGAYLVGGAVRDLFVHGHPKDFDIATDATPEQIKDVFRNCRLIGRRFRLAHVFFGGEIIEVATFRANHDDGSGDRATENGRLVRDNVYGTIEDDAVRRDFTCNALYYAIDDYSVRDYVGGVADIQRRVMRLIGDPEQRYREDPVRMLRAVRLAAKLHFQIEPATAAPIRPLSSLLAAVSPARLFEESMKLFLSGHAVASFHGLEQFGLYAQLFPDSSVALAHNSKGVLRHMLLVGLHNTDQRVAQENLVSPTFLFALLLWPAFCRQLVALQAKGYRAQEALLLASERVILRQSKRVALPKRFSMPMQEIWLLQHRWGIRQPKRVLRTLAHRRFRAAYDFLLLRQAADPTHAADIAFWHEAQQDGVHGALTPDNALPTEPGAQSKTPSPGVGS